MSEHFKNLRRVGGMHQASPEELREAAVSAALTLVLAKVANSPSNGGALEYEMSCLSTYADQIQEALQVK